MVCCGPCWYPAGSSACLWTSCLWRRVPDQPQGLCGLLWNDWGSLSLQTVLRIWDCLFNEGSKIIFRVALTLIKQHQEFILEASSVPDICDKFKQITKGDFVTECHTFMQVSSGLLGLCREGQFSVLPSNSVLVSLLSISSCEQLPPWSYGWS